MFKHGKDINLTFTIMLEGGRFNGLKNINVEKEIKSKVKQESVDLEREITFKKIVKKYNKYS